MEEIGGAVWVKKEWMGSMMQRNDKGSDAEKVAQWTMKNCEKRIFSQILFGIPVY